MKQYLDLLNRIVRDGEESDDRTGIGTISTFGETMKFDLRQGFPIVTTKKVAWKSVVSELLWFIRGSDNVHELREILHGKEHRENFEKKTIWDANYLEQGEKQLGYKDGYMGSIYGTQWRAYGKCQMQYTEFNGIDQLKNAIDEIINNPTSRRIIVNAWNPIANNGGLGSDDNRYAIYSAKPVLPPCHVLFQFNVQGDYLDLLFFMRSNDSLLGTPFNVSSYGLLLAIVAKITNKTPRYLIAQIGNAHIYKNHIDAVAEQVTREPLPLPSLEIAEHIKTLDDVCNSTIDDYKLIGYQHHGTIKADMAV